MKFLAKVLTTGVGVWIATLLVPGLTVTDASTPQQTAFSIGVFALILVLVNGIIRPVVKLISLPFYILTLGLFALVVSALMFLLAGYIASHTGTGILVADFWAALLGSLVTSVIATPVAAWLEKSK